MTPKLGARLRQRGLANDEVALVVIRPYSAEDYPSFFEDPDSTVTVVSARRTLWEKATALHAEAYRPAHRRRHSISRGTITTLATFLDTDEGKAAAIDFELLAQMAKHKAAASFRSGWASYNTARPDTLRLMPNEARIKDPPPLLDHAKEGVQLGDADGLAVPFGLEQIDVTSKLEAAVDLFAAEPERFVGGQTECVEQAPEETLQVALNPSRRGLVRAVVSQVPGRIDLSYLGPDDLSAA